MATCPEHAQSGAKRSVVAGWLWPMIHTDRRSVFCMRPSSALAHEYASEKNGRTRGAINKINIRYTNKAIFSRQGSRLNMITPMHMYVCMLVCELAAPCATCGCVRCSCWLYLYNKLKYDYRQKKTRLTHFIS